MRLAGSRVWDYGSGSRRKGVAIYSEKLPLLIPSLRSGGETRLAEFEHSFPLVAERRDRKLFPLSVILPREVKGEEEPKPFN